MKRSLKVVVGVLLALCLLGLILFFATWPRAGHWMYDLGTTLEARLAGLRTAEADAGDLRLVYSRGGMEGGEAIVLLHGYSSDRQIWTRFARQLPQHYDIVIPDLAGHGDTAFVSGLDYGIPAQAQRVAVLMDALGIEQAHLVGNSMGGFIAAQFALSYPERTLSAALFDPAGVTAPQPSDMDRLEAQGRNVFEVHSAEEFEEFYAMTMAQPPWLPRILLAAMAERYQERRAELAEIFLFLQRAERLEERLGTIETPALIVWGDQDRLLHVSAAPVWAEGLPNAELVIMEGIGHMPMFEEPAEAARIYLDFLSRLKH